MRFSYFSTVCAAFNKAVAIFLLILSVGIAGCSSSGSNISAYGARDVSSASAKLSQSRRSVKKTRTVYNAAKKRLRKTSRAVSRDVRRLKRKKLSKKSRAKIVQRLTRNKKAKRVQTREFTRAERDYKRAQNASKRAKRNVDLAKRRKTEADRKAADLKKRREQEAARKAIERDNPKPSRGYASLFGYGDPASQNVSDYQARVDGGFSVAAIPVDKMNSRLLRQQVRYVSRHKPGTIVVDTGARYLYLVQGGGKAMRYGIGVGRQGFSWSGTAHVGWKQAWPKWTPPAEMIERQPKLAKFSADNGGMPGGPKNPLGARALYLMKDGKDTLYRLHGTPQWSSIGTAASSGCIRLMNQDIIDLYKRVRNGTQVVVL